MVTPAKFMLALICFILMLGIIPTLIASIYGMNFEHMPELTWELGYPLALGLMATLSYAMYRFLKRVGWL